MDKEMSNILVALGSDIRSTYVLWKLLDTTDHTVTASYCNVAGIVSDSTHHKAGEQQAVTSVVNYMKTNVRDFTFEVYTPTNETWKSDETMIIHWSRYAAALAEAGTYDEVWTGSMAVVLSSSDEDAPTYTHANYGLASKRAFDGVCSDSTKFKFPFREWNKNLADVYNELPSAIKDLVPYCLRVEYLTNNTFLTCTDRESSNCNWCSEKHTIETQLAGGSNTIQTWNYYKASDAFISRKNSSFAGNPPLNANTTLWAAP